MPNLKTTPELLSDEALAEIEARRYLYAGQRVLADRDALCQTVRAAWAENADLHNAVAKTWEALGVTEYTGKHISEHVTALREQLAEAQQRRVCDIQLIRDRAARYGDEEGLSQVLEALADELENPK